MAGIVIKPRARILHGHDWVFSSEVLKVFGHPADGDVISLKDGKDHLIGSAIYNSKSQIVARRFSRRRQDLDQDFFRRRIEQASEYRDRRNIDTKLRRVVWSESDGLPGVIIDRYGDDFVLQTLTLAMDMRKDLVVDAIEQCSATVQRANQQGASGTHAQCCIIERNDAPVRKAEAMELRSGVLRGTPSQTVVEVAGVKLEVDFLRGHKTGLYLDQKHNYGIVAEHAGGRRVLDCFTNQGAFALTCARAGAMEVTGVEENSENIAAAKRNAGRNQLKVEWVQQDVFQFLRGAEKAGAQYDVIVLDPPSFTRTKSGLRDALRGYRELHTRAFKLLAKDGLLATFSCSHHVDDSSFLRTITDALVDARRSARRLRRFEQAADHPVLPTIPETEYFKGFLLEMMPGR
ncbi:MAG TPA: class I SAM-dependent rRNA methyltransferase [Candidatus Udaeobacter sp.]|jgi:23S rRNA (cytosine1962-C5)-methyltransferase|nr:class I SAM-dependent rRNA methyltransferase [Candidatus Udaeobacter sp.]